MSDNQNTLRAIVSRWHGGIQAQLLELDMAVHGSDENDIFEEIAHAITVSYEIAKAHGEAPFSSIGEPPKAIRDQWRSSPSVPMIQGHIELNDEIALALATAMRWRKPARAVALEDVVAA